MEGVFRISIHRIILRLHTMGVLERIKPVDVICQHSADGTIIPLRIWLTDEDGMKQTYTIKGYRDLSHQGTREMPDGVYVSNNTLIYE